MQPKPGEDGNYPVDKATAISGEKLLRNIMSDNKIELYATYVSLFGKNRTSPFSDFVLIKNGDYNLLPSWCSSHCVINVPCAFSFSEFQFFGWVIREIVYS